MQSRRAFLTLLGAAATARPAQSFTGPLGLEIYSLRREMAKDVPGTLAGIRQLGFEEVEVPGYYGLSVEAFRRELDKADLRATAMVAQEAVLRKDLAQVAGEAHTLGATYAVYPWIGHITPFSAEAALRACENMNRWGAALKREGVEFLYHPHGYEFRPSPEGTLFDLMAAKTDKSVVNFQLDVFWVAWPGQDPVAYMKRYPDRMPVLHLKELRKGEKTGDLSGTAPEETSGIVGSGMIDFPAVLNTARRIGVKRYYLEDEAVNAAEQIPINLKYLRSVTW
jgi:sugar phosphate isomerase/epimerase